MRLLKAYIDGPWPKYGLVFIAGLAGGCLTERTDFWGDVTALSSAAAICAFVIAIRWASGDDE